MGEGVLVRHLRESRVQCVILVYRKHPCWERVRIFDNTPISPRSLQTADSEEALAFDLFLCFSVELASGQSFLFPSCPVSHFDMADELEGEDNSRGLKGLLEIRIRCVSQPGMHLESCLWNIKLHPEVWGRQNQAGGW